MISVRVTTACGNTWVSGFNGTYEEARAHFMGHRFEKMVPANNWCKCREVLQEPVVRVERLT